MPARAVTVSVFSLNATHCPSRPPLHPQPAPGHQARILPAQFHPRIQDAQRASRKARADELPDLVGGHGVEHREQPRAVAGDDIPADQRDDIPGRLQAARQVSHAGHKNHQGAAACDVVADPPLRAAEIAGFLDRRHRTGITGVRRMVSWGAHPFITFGNCSGFGTGRQGPTEAESANLTGRLLSPNRTPRQQTAPAA